MDSVKRVFQETTSLSLQISALMIAMHVAGRFFPSFVTLISLAPAYTVGQNYYVWNLFTAALYEQNILLLFINITVMIVFGTYSKSVWSRRETIKFYCVVNIMTGITSFACYIFLYAIKHDEAYLFQPVFGFYGIIGSMLVVWKQQEPEKSVLFLPVKFLPTIYAIMFALLPQFLPVGANMLFGSFGTFYGWFYLRFYQKHDNGSPRGDQNEHFGFHTFFPSFTHKPILAVCRVLYRFLGCLTRFEESVQIPSPSLFLAPHQPLPGSDPIESERRRQLAMKVMEERFASSGGTHNMTSTTSAEV